MLGTPRTDSSIDDEFRRRKNAGGIWIVGSVVLFAIGMFAGSPSQLGLAWLLGVVLFAIGMIARRQAWRSMRRDVGDEAMLKATWRMHDREHELKVWRAIAWFLLIGGLTIYLEVAR